MEQRFGNVTLGEINKMLISFIGKDMYLSFWEKENPKESIGAYKKHLNRLFVEEDNNDLTALSLTDNDSITKFVFEKIIPILKNNYFLSDNLISYLRNFVIELYNKFTDGIPILESYLYLDSFYDFNFLEQAKQKYISVFEEIDTKYGSLKKFRENFPNEDTIKNVINAMKNRGDNPTWFILKQLLDELKDDKQITALLIDAYIMRNIYDTLHNKVETKSIIDGRQYAAIDWIYEGIHFYFDDYGYKKNERRADKILRFVGKCTKASEFYCNWFRAYYAFAKGNLKSAKVYYEKAFAARQFAGEHFEKFIKQAFALSCYLDFYEDTVRKSADDNSKSKSPLSRDAKKYWNYGYTVGVFDRKAEETHLITYYRVEHILTYFGTELFPENSEFYKKLLNERLSLYMVKLDESDFDDEYEKISKLTEKKINTRTRLFGSHPTKNPSLTLALFYIDSCYSYGYADLAGKFIELVKDWLDNFDLDFNLCSDKGCSIVCDAIQQYKKLKLHHLDLDLTELKRIVLRIIDKSNEDSLTRSSLQKKRCALQEAIESCDMDIVKAVVEKLNGIEHLRISPDEDSPVYYSISRYVCLYRYINDPTFKIQDGNINYNNLDVPGLTKEDKIQYIKVIESNPKLAEEIYKSIMQQLYGVEEMWGSELIDIKNICLYLIEQTKDQDGYYKKTKDENLVTSLLFAAESKNVEICRKLINYKANPNIYRPAFLERCIYWGSYDVLAMYLEEFPEQAKIGINETDNIFHLPLLKAFIFRFINISIENKNYKDRALVKHIIELFKKCGARY